MAKRLFIQVNDYDEYSLYRLSLWDVIRMKSKRPAVLEDSGRSTFCLGKNHVTVEATNISKNMISPSVYALVYYWINATVKTRYNIASTAAVFGVFWFLDYRARKGTFNPYLVDWPSTFSKCLDNKVVQRADDVFLIDCDSVYELERLVNVGKLHNREVHVIADSKTTSNNELAIMKQAKKLNLPVHS